MNINEQSKDKFVLTQDIRNTLYDQISTSNLFKMPQPMVKRPQNNLDPINISKKKSMRKRVELITNFLSQSKSLNKIYKKQLRREKFTIASNQFKELRKNMRTSAAKHIKIFHNQQTAHGRFFRKPIFLPVLDKDEDIRPEILLRKQLSRDHIRSRPNWQHLSKYGKIFDKKLFGVKKRKQRYDKYFFMTMAEIRASLVWRVIAPQNKDKAWRYTFKPQEKFSKPHPSRYHFFKKRVRSHFLQEDPFLSTKKFGKEFSKGIASII